MSVIETHTKYSPRITLFYYMVGAIVAVLGTGLAYRQLFSKEAYTNRERIQNQRRILIPGPRGEIYDREGRVLVANRPRFSAVLYFADSQLRRELSDEQFRLVRDVRRGKTERPALGYATQSRMNVVQRYLDQCNKILGRNEQIDSVSLERHYNQQPLLPFPIINDLAPEEFARLVEQLPPGSPIQVYASTMRHYPYGEAAAHTLGFVRSTLDLPDEGLPGADLTTFNSRGTYGVDGIELQFDDRLQGRTGSEIWIVEHNGIQDRRIESHPPVPGNPVYTSLDVDLQIAGEQAFGDRAGALVLIDVRTGEILALVSRPAYDLNDFTPVLTIEKRDEIENRGAWINRATQGLYPPGSPFKLVTAIAALRAGVSTPDTVIDCDGAIYFGRLRIRCHSWRRGGHGPLDLRGAISASCNVYFITLGMRLGPDNLALEARRFGLGEQTGIDLPFEATRTLVPDPAWKRARWNEPWTSGNTAHMSFGQGDLLVTPLQMACFAASLARDETRTRPTILRRDDHTPLPVANNQALGLSPSDRAAIFDGMVMSASVGTGREIRIPGVNLAAKTGTAQKSSKQGMFELAWFLGYGPVENPAVAIVVLVEGDEPDELNAGGHVAAPRARAVLELYFKKHPPETLGVPVASRVP